MTNTKMMRTPCFFPYGVGTGILVFKARVFLLGGIQGFEHAHVQKEILPLPAEKL